MNATPSTPRGSASSSTTAQVSPSRHTTLASSSSPSPSRSPSGRIAHKSGIQSATSPSSSSARADRLASELTAEERLDLVRRNRKLTKLLGDEVVREKSHLKARSVSPRREAPATTAASTLPLSNSVQAQLGSDDADDGSTSCTSIFLQHVAPGSRSPTQTPLPPQMSAKAAALLGVSPSSSSSQQQQLANATKKLHGSPTPSILESSASTRQRRSLDSLQSRGSLSLSHDAAAAASASAVPASLRSHGRAQSQHTTTDLGSFAAAHASWLDLDNTLDDPATSGDAASINEVDLHPSNAPSSPPHDRADRRRRVEKMTRWLGNVVPAHIVAPEAGNDAPAYMYDEAPLSALRFAAATSMGRTSSAPPRAGTSGGGGAEDHYLRVKRANKLEQLLGEGAAAVSGMQPQPQALGKGPLNVPAATAGTAAPRDLEAESSDEEDEDDELVDASEGESDAPRVGVHDEDTMDLDEADANDEHGARRRRAAKAQKLTRFFGQRVEQEHLVGGGGGGGAGASPAL